MRTSPDYEQCDLATVHRRLDAGLPLTRDQSEWLFEEAFTLKITRRKRCRCCDGTGKLEWDRCDSCEGMGYQCICNDYARDVTTSGPFRSDCPVHGHLVD